MLNQYWHAVARVFPTPGNKTSLFAPRPRRRDCRHGPSWTPSPTRARKSTEPSSRSTSCCLNRSAVGPLGSRNSARRRRVAGTPKNRAPAISRYSCTSPNTLSTRTQTSHAQRLTPHEGHRQILRMTVSTAWDRAYPRHSQQLIGIPVAATTHEVKITGNGCTRPLPPASVGNSYPVVRRGRREPVVRHRRAGGAERRVLQRRRRRGEGRQPDHRRDPPRPVRRVRRQHPGRRDPHGGTGAGRLMGTDHDRGRCRSPLRARPRRRRATTVSRPTPRCRRPSPRT